MSSTPIRWGRVLLGGLFIELAMFAFVIPLTAIGEQVLYYAVPFLAFGIAVVFGWWVARPLSGRQVLHGALVAVAASLMYIALTTAMGVAGTLPLLYHVSHGLRILGGMLGGSIAARHQAAPAPAQPL